MNHPRRQQYRRAARAARLAIASAAAAVLGVGVVTIGAAVPGAMLLVLAVVVGVRARHWLALAGRSRVGARSEDDMQRALVPLRAEGWPLRHTLRW